MKVIDRIPPYYKVELQKPKTTFCMLRNAAELIVESDKYVLTQYWCVDTTKSRKKLVTRIMWRLSKWLYNKYKPMTFYDCRITIRMDAQELGKLKQTVEELL